MIDGSAHADARRSEDTTFVPVEHRVLTYHWIYRNTAPIQRGWARAILAPEVADGAAAEDEVEAFVGTRKARKA